MDRLTTLLEHFSPRSQQIDLLIGQQSELVLPADSTISIVHQGSAHLSVAGEVDTHLQQGDLIWVTRDSHRHISVDSDDFQLLCCQLKFGPVTLNPIFDLLPPVLQIKHDDQARQSLDPIVQLLLQESLQSRCGQSAVLGRLAEVLLVHVLRFFMAHQKIKKGVVAGLSDIRLARAITAIHRQPEQRWSTESLATEAGMSRTAFNQHFRETVGCPPGEYLNQWRMRLACRLLESSSILISQIVGQLGYQSETAFFRAFRKRFGTSPRKYRQQTSLDPASDLARV
ncbi:MAG: AraC-like DNA-binding protein [Gammaproteobacteria bacterium]|jgi:AraC-like DNA-binding protein